jgi:DNA-binding response OmpR family regulator
VNLLVCDDDETACRFVSSVFTEQGWAVETVLSGEACIAKLDEFAADMILLDQVMPGMTGVDAARVIRAKGFEGPIILFSAYLGPDLEPAIAALELEAISKFDMDAAIARIEELGRTRP